MFTKKESMLFIFLILILIEQISYAQTFIRPAVIADGKETVRITHDYAEKSTDAKGVVKYHSGIDSGAAPQGDINNRVSEDADVKAAIIEKALSSDIFTIQPGPEGKDTFYGTVYVTNGAPNAGSLYVGGWGDKYYDFFQFDLTGSPSAADTESATLYLYGSAPNDPEFRLKRITRRWTERGVTLAHNPASVFYKKFGSFAVGADAWNLVDITDLYKKWKDGTYRNCGIKLVPTKNNQTNGWIASSDNDNSDIRPKIIVTHCARK